MPGSLRAAQIVIREAQRSPSTVIEVAGTGKTTAAAASATVLGLARPAESSPSVERAPTRVAIVGCGVVTELGHLPALQKVGQRAAILVDPDLERAGRLAREFGVGRTARDYRDVAGEVDAAVVAVPPHLHAPISIDLLSQGVHVLVEKPMARSHQECVDMLGAAQPTGAVLAVGLMRRFLPASQWTKRVLSERVLGDVTSFTFRDGFAFSWPAVSDSLFRRETAGGGVLMDLGPHTIDQLLWWLGPVRTVEYADDAFGGVEADCMLTVEMESGARGSLDLSWTRELRSSAVIEGTEGRLEVALEGDWANGTPARSLPLPARSRRRRVLRPRSFSSHTWVDLIALELRDWLDAIAGEGRPAGSAADAAAGIGVIEQCYAVRKPLFLPWMATARAA